MGNHTDWHQRMPAPVLSARVESADSSMTARHVLVFTVAYLLLGRWVPA